MPTYKLMNITQTLTNLDEYRKNELIKFYKKGYYIKLHKFCEEVGCTMPTLTKYLYKWMHEEETNPLNIKYDELVRQKREAENKLSFQERLKLALESTSSSESFPTNAFQNMHQ
jgi:tRNA nucleotidyltransferase/poly(A) polymerase